MIVRGGNFRKPYTVTSLCLQLILTTAADDKGGTPLSDTMAIKVIAMGDNYRETSSYFPFVYS